MSLELSLFETRLVNLSLDNGEFGQRLPKFFVTGEIDLLTTISSEGCICLIVGGFHLVNCILSLTNFTNNELQNSCGFEQGKDCYIFFLVYTLTIQIQLTGTNTCLVNLLPEQQQDILLQRCLLNVT